MRSALILTVCLACSFAHAQDVNDAYEKAAKAAAAKAAPWIAKIETSGGREVIGPKGGGGGGIRKGSGPTSGLVVGADGYVITSSFNFANNPTDIFVTVPGRERKFAKIVARDSSRMLTLLKLKMEEKEPPLPMPEVFPKKEVLVGQLSLAMGRGNDLDPSKPPMISTGIVSAVGRIWGKAIQTDAKVSPVNYGGPLVALDGRVLGVLVPLSPDGEGDTAGVEWYDSGIGFAIPLEDVLAVVPRLKKLKEGESLGRGMLGFTVKQPEERYNVPVVVVTVAPQSAGEKIGLKPNDKIIKLDGKAVSNFSELMHLLGPKYEGDPIDIVVERDGKEVKFDQVALGGNAPSVSLAFLGILPMRDDPEQGIEIRYVYPNTPAEKAGLKAGDRILKFGPASGPPLAAMAGRGQLATAVRSLPSGLDVKVEVKRAEGEKTETLTFKLVPLSEELPEKLPMPSSKGKALEPKKGAAPPKKGEEPKEQPKKEEPKKDDEEKLPPKGLLVDQTNEATGRSYWMYVPDNYDKNKSYGVIVWFHNTGKAGKDAKDMKKIWEEYCDSTNFILIGPQSKTGNEWVATELEGVVQTINTALQPYTIDRSRVVVHGMGNGGSMALYAAFNARDLIRGCCVSGAVLPGNAKDNLPNQPLAFYIVAGDKDPLLKEIKETNDKLRAKKFPTVFKELKEFGKEYLDQPTLVEICKWLDSLDRI